MSSSALSDAALDQAQLLADPLADATAARLIGPWPDSVAHEDAPQWQRIASVNRCFAQWGTNANLNLWRAADADLLPEQAQALDDYLRQGQQLPDWADPVQIERAERIFMEQGALSCMLLFCASLPQCYVVPDLSSVLHTAGQLEQHTEHRIRSTAAMIFPVMLQGGLTRPDGSGIAQVLKVRLIHATIRHLILRGTPQEAVVALEQGAQAAHVPALKLPGGPSSLHHTLFARGWDTARDGLPCNQEELAYTLLTFGYVFLQGLRRLGIGLPPTDEQAYLHTWNVVGHVLGIERQFMVHDMAQGAALFARMQARGRAEPLTPDPRPALGAALLGTMSQAIPWRIARPFPMLMTRHLCGDATASDLGLASQQAPWSSVLLFQLLLGGARSVDAVARLVSPRFSLSRCCTRILGFHFISRLLLDQTRPLNLPAHLLHQVQGVVHHWSDDPLAPRWLNAIEDRFTTPGTWAPLPPANA
jgi:hypothetical protein